MNRFVSGVASALVALVAVSAVAADADTTRTRTRRTGMVLEPTAPAALPVERGLSRLDLGDPGGVSTPMDASSSLQNLVVTSSAGTNAAELVTVPDAVQPADLATHSTELVAVPDEAAASLRELERRVLETLQVTQVPFTPGAHAHYR